MATRLPAVPVEEYLRTFYEPDMEYVNEQLVERRAGEYFHSWLQSLIVTLLGSRNQPPKFRVFTEQRLQVNDQPRYRIPDICVKALPHKPLPVLTHVDLAIEILSPDDEPAEMLEKIADYTGAGITHVWIVDPYKRRVVTVENSVLHRLAGFVTETPLVGPVDFGELFRQLDEPAE